MAQFVLFLISCTFNYLFFILILFFTMAPLGHHRDASVPLPPALCGILRFLVFLRVPVNLIVWIGKIIKNIPSQNHGDDRK